MTNIDITNGIVFQALSINKDSFDDRLIAQKKIYLLQELGINIGYSFNWYIRGPYSPHLTSYLYNNYDMLKEQDFTKYHLSDPAKKTINKVNDFSKACPESLSNASWYELLASVLYIIKNWKEKDTFDTLTKYKPKYKKEEYNIKQ